MADDEDLVLVKVETVFRALGVSDPREDIRKARLLLRILMLVEQRGLDGPAAMARAGIGDDERSDLEARRLCRFTMQRLAEIAELLSGKWTPRVIQGGRPTSPGNHGLKTIPGTGPSSLSQQEQSPPTTRLSSRLHVCADSGTRQEPPSWIVCGTIGAGGVGCTTTAGGGVCARMTVPGTA
jgi:hypothetical protein